MSPIIGDAPVHGMADACLAAIGVATTAAAVAAHYGAGLLDGWLVDERDKAAVDAPELAGIAVRALPLYMTTWRRRRRSPAAGACELAGGAGPMTRSARGRPGALTVLPVTGLPEIGAGADLAALISRGGARTCATATSWSSRPRSSARPRAGW